MVKRLCHSLCADLALVNGKVLTVDEENSIAEAVATKYNRIMVVGSNEDVEQVIGENTEIYDVEGRTVLPGLIDSHMHPAGYGASRVRGVKCGPDVYSIEELLRRIEEKAETTPEGSWIQGYSLDDLGLGRYPTRQELDSVTPNNPLYIGRRDGHIGVANSLALEIA